MSVYIKDPKQPALACVLWMHGLGSNAQDMAGLADELPITLPIRHVFLDAPIRPVTMNRGQSMRAWYDIVGTRLADREDHVGILQSEAFVHDIIEQQLHAGFKSHQIFLSGFSQGAAMALRAGLHAQRPLGGIIALSGYLPLLKECQPKQSEQLPIWIAAGRLDSVVLPSWTKQSADWLISNGFQNVFWQEYSMGHTVCLDEIRALATWLSSQISSFSHRNGVME